MKNPNGLASPLQERVGVFTISSITKKSTMVSKPDFSSNHEDKVTNEPVKKVRRKPKKKVAKVEPTPINLEEFSN